MVTDSVRKIGKNSLTFCYNLGSAMLMLLRAIFYIPSFKKEMFLIIKQFFNIGILSLPIILSSAFFIGMVLGLQGYTTLSKYGATESVGQLIALSLVRELGPVVGALLFAGRAGSALTAEIAHMKTTEQLTSLELMGIDPVYRVISTRFWAGFFSMPILILIFNVVAIFGGYVVTVKWLHLDSGTFWSNMQSSVDFYNDTFNGIIKSIVFGFMVMWVSLYQGINARPTAEGISYATTRTVVLSSLTILFLDFILTAIMFGGLS